MSDPVVSVVIPAYNAAGTLDETLRALHAQAGAPPFEIIVVDNASTDATADVARAEGATTVLFEPKRGPAAARNRGLFAARGQIIAHCDADTVPTRRWLRELCAPFADPKTILVAGNTICYPLNTPAERYMQASGVYDTQRKITRTPFPFAPSLNLAVRKEAACSIGGWTEDLLTGEDVDFSHRLLNAYPTEIAYASKAILYHRGRTNDEALCRQAWTWGEGAADLYRRYPNELHWNLLTLWNLVYTIFSSAVLEVVARIAGAIGVMKRDRFEFLCYHSLWLRRFWLGYWTRYITGRRK